MVAHRFFFFLHQIWRAKYCNDKDKKKTQKKKGKTRQHENHLGCLLSFIQN